MDPFFAISIGGPALLAAVDAIGSAAAPALTEALGALRTHALLGIPVGLATGLALGLVSTRVEDWGGYASERLRAARLSHVSFVMLPALSGLYSTLLPSSAAAGGLLGWATWLWIGGSIALSLALAVLAARPTWKALLPVPALAVVAGSVLLGVAGLAG